MKKLLLAAFLLPLFGQILGQTPAKPTSADLLQSLKKLQVLGSVLYVAAHPDDENTRMISYLVNEKLYTVTYLSLTRGDGGQNLIGPEIRELLGVIRTEELMAARRIDGGQQLFSRANDYGYSKKPSEAFRTWNRAEVTEDVVWAFRKTQPDVVINRFTTDTSFDNHGHHTASAILSAEVFDLAGKREIFPEQFKFGVETWQPKRLFFNTSWWFYGSREKFEAADKSNLWSLDLGVFLPLKGRSNTEIAAESRSMHRCQGFGSLGTRGEQKEFLDFLKGERPKNDDIFDGVNATWTRVAGGEKIGKALAAIEQNFKFDNPAASLPELVKVEKAIAELPDGFWKKTKLAEIRALIKGCAGLWLEAVASDASATPGEKIKVKLEAISRMSAAKLVGFSIQPALLDTTMNFEMLKNKGIFIEKTVQIPAAAQTTAPYWLLENFDIGMYKVPDQKLRGLPETPRFSKVVWKIEIAGQLFEYETDLLFKKEVPERGEIYQPFEALPPVTVSIAEPNYIFYKREKQIEVKVRAGKGQISGSVALELPTGWKAEPAVQNFDIKKKGADKSLIFNVLAPEKDSEGWARAVATVDGKTYSQRLVSINYEHIPTQSVLLAATSKIARADVRTTARRIGYYMGAGDEVPEALRQIGCEVELLDDENVPSADVLLKNYDAIVLGVRAYNAKDNIVFHHEKFLEYARTGGTLVVQYNTTGDLAIKDVAPFQMKIGRDRVTMEDAPVRILKPEHTVLNSPNKIAPKDFDNWFQERGLYFPSEWGPEMEAILSMNDPGEKPKDGSLLVARCGTGWYVYTGLSFFRELPAGVPGAYRLFANLISLGKGLP